MLCSAHITSLAHNGLLRRKHVLDCNAGSPLAQPFRCNAPAPWACPQAQRRRTITAAKKHGSGAPEALKKIENPPTSAEKSVNRGLEVFKGGKAGEAATRQALALFEAAMLLQPSRPEARAALYNAGCCHVKLKQWQAAVDAVEEAVNEQGLKLNIAQEDKDLAPLRERREWLDAVGRLKGGVSDKTLVQLRSEAKAPLRLSRLIVGSGLLAGAAVGLVIIAARLVQALQGGEGAPELTETLKNLGINGVAVAALGWLVRWDLAASDRDKVLVQREEGLARLQVSVSGDRVLPLASFRGTTRPVLLAGSRSWLQRTMQAAEPYREQLRERGVSLLPLNSRAAEAEDPSERLRALKREFRGDESAAEAKGFGPAKEAKLPKSAPAAPQKDRKWQLEAYNVPEWLEWMSAQLKAANVAEGENVYVQVSLDGTVRSSGVGVPPWDRWLGDLAPLDDIRSRLTKQ